MSTNLKRILFWGLFSLFVFDTIILYSIENDSPEAKLLLTEQAKSGKLIFQKYNCIACHQIYGLGGYMGPDLTNVISQKGKGPLYALAFLKNGTQRMPNFKLSEMELLEIVAFLNYVDKTGRSPVLNYTTRWNGTIETKE